MSTPYPAMDVHCPQCVVFVTDHLPVFSSENMNFTRTNIAPPDNVRQDAVDYLADAKMQLAIITEKAEHVEKTLQLLRQHQEKLRTAIESQQTIVHPIRRVPPDVLSMIFKACLGHSNTMDSFEVTAPQHRVRDSLDPSQPPWTLTRVCHSWRSVALSYSSLWSYVAVPLPSCYEHEEKAQYTLLQLIIQQQRSKLQPLTISMTYPRSRCLGYQKGRNRHIVTLCSQSWRWDSVHLSFASHSDDIFLEICSIIKEKVPLLRRLFLEYLDTPKLHGALESAPSLRELSIRAPNGSTRTLVSSLHLPWSQITRFCFKPRSSTGDVSFSFLRNMPNLQILTVIVWAAPLSVLVPPSSEFPSLKTFTIITKEDSTIPAAFLDAFVLEHLRDLCIDRVFDVDALIRLLKRTPTVRSLSLRSRDGLNAAELVACIQSAPSLESLSLCDVPNGFINALADSTPAEHLFLLENLRKLALYAPCAVEDAQLIKLARGRGAGFTLELDRALSLDSETKEELEKIEGLVVLHMVAHEGRRFPCQR